MKVKMPMLQKQDIKKILVSFATQLTFYKSSPLFDYN